LVLVLGPRAILARADLEDVAHARAQDNQPGVDAAFESGEIV
jgi:hypothetical protein